MGISGRGGKVVVERERERMRERERVREQARRENRMQGSRKKGHEGVSEGRERESK